MPVWMMLQGSVRVHIRSHTLYTRGHRDEMEKDERRESAIRGERDRERDRERERERKREQRIEGEEQKAKSVSAWVLLACVRCWLSPSPILPAAFTNVHNRPPPSQVVNLKPVHARKGHMENYRETGLAWLRCTNFPSFDTISPIDEKLSAEPRRGNASTAFTQVRWSFSVDLCPPSGRVYRDRPDEKSPTR